MAYPTAAEIRSRVTDLVNVDAFPDVVLTDLVSEFQALAERYKGVAYVSTTTTEIRTLRNQRQVSVTWPFIASVSSAVSVFQGVTTTLVPSNFIIDYPRPTIDLGAYYTGQLTIVYTHGITTTPPAITRACREYVRSCALRDRSTVGRDVIAQSVDGGGTTRFSTPDASQRRPTGYIEVDRLLNSLPDYQTHVG